MIAKLIQSIVNSLRAVLRAFGVKEYQYTTTPEKVASRASVEVLGDNPATQSDYMKEWDKQFSRFIRFVRNDRFNRAVPVPVSIAGPDTLEYIQDLPGDHPAKIALLNRLSKKDRNTLFEQIADAGRIEDDADIDAIDAMDSRERLTRSIDAADRATDKIGSDL